MGGSYVHDGLEALAGVLTIPLASDAKISLSMSKVGLTPTHLSFLDFVSELFFLVIGRVLPFDILLCK